MSRRASTIVAVAAVVLALAGVAIAMSSSEPRLAGTNDLRNNLPILIPAGQRLCQGPEFVPGDAARVQVAVTTTGGSGPPLAFEVLDEGVVAFSGTVDGGYGDGGVLFPLEPATEPLVAEEVCIENRGDSHVLLSGQPFEPELAARIGEEPAEGRVRLDYVRAGDESWFELAGTVLHRFGLGKAGWLGSWTLVASALLIALAWIAALALLLRRREA